MSRRHTGNNRKTERGNALLVMFFALSLMASYIVSNFTLSHSRYTKEQADQTAWLINEITQAARLYVRDQDATGGGIYTKENLCAAARPINASDLINGGYIGNNIGNVNANDRFETPLKQEVFIIAANSRINPAACTPADLTDQAATAYVILKPPATGMTRELIPLLAESLSQNGMPTNPPRWNAAGVNVSTNCGSGPATLQWDTGCMTLAQYQFLLPTETSFPLNTIAVPAWLAFRGDPRAVFRYDQAENPAATSMQTDLYMAPPPDPATCTNVSYSGGGIGGGTSSTTVNSGICNVTGDTAATDNRLDIVNAGSISAQRVIADPQVYDNNAGGGSEAIGSFDLDNSGVGDPVTVQINGAATIAGNARMYSTSEPGLLVMGGDVNMTNPASKVSVVSLGGTGPSVSVGDIAVGTVQSNDMTATTATVGNETFVNNTLTLQPGGEAVLADPGNVGRSVVMNNISGTVREFHVGDDLIVGGTFVNMSHSGTTYDTIIFDLASSLSYSLAANTVNAKQIGIAGGVQVGRQFGISAGGGVGGSFGINPTNTTIPSLNPASGTTIANCTGDCPQRTPQPGAPL